MWLGPLKTAYTKHKYTVYFSLFLPVHSLHFQSGVKIILNLASLAWPLSFLFHIIQHLNFHVYKSECFRALF